MIDATHQPDGLAARGCLPREDTLGSQFPVFEDAAVQPIPRSQWPDLLEQNYSLEHLVRKIKNQGREGSCASNATCTAFEIVWNMTLGLQAWIEMSPISVYRWVARGPNSGSTIGGNLRQISNVGCLPVNTSVNQELLATLDLDPRHVLASTGFYQSFPSDWQTTAKEFVALEWFDIASFEGVVTALLLDFPVVYGRAGHAICGVAPVIRNRAYHIKYANSWSPQWGENGYGYDSESFISRAISSYGAFAIRAIKLTDKALELVRLDHERADRSGQPYITTT